MSERIKQAKALDHADRVALVRRIVRTLEESIDWEIAEFEAATGMAVTEGERKAILAEALSNQPE